MKGTCLVAETCRAGRWNHRFIVAQGAGVSDVEASHFVTRARESEEGTDYLAALDRQVVQPSTGRYGDDVLVLAGIDVGRLPEKKKEALRKALRELLNDLATMVADRIDWEREGGSEVVPRPELTEWYRDKLQPIVERAEKLDAPKGAATSLVRSPWRRISRIARPALGVMLAVAFIAVLWVFGGHAFDGCRPRADDSQRLAALEGLCTACGVSPSVQPGKDASPLSGYYDPLDHALRAKLLIDDQLATPSDDAGEQPLDPEKRFVEVAWPLYQLLVRPDAAQQDGSEFLLDQQFVKEVGMMWSSDDAFRYLKRHAEDHADKEAKGPKILNRLFPNASARSVANFRNLARRAREAAEQTKKVIDAGERPRNSGNVLKIASLTNELREVVLSTSASPLPWSFFVDADASAAEVLWRWLCENEDTTDLIGRHSDLSEALGALAGQKDQIDDQMGADVPKSHPPALQALREFVDAADQLITAELASAGPP